MKTVRIREKIKAFLAERPRNTAEILEHINSTMRHGTTSQQLGNVLSKDKDIVKVGYIKRSGILSGGYDICEWATRIWVSDNYPEWDGEGPILMDRDRRDSSVNTQLPSTWGFGPGLLGVFFFCSQNQGYP